MGVPKINDVISRVWAEHGTVLSMEFFPARTEEGIANLLLRVADMVATSSPHFVTLTWRSAFKDESSWLSIGTQIQKHCGIPVLLHLTCHLPVPDLKRILQSARECGIRNILALRGDPPIGTERWRPVPGGLEHAVDLVRLIRQEHGDYFCVAVAAYPEVHVETWNATDLPPSQQARALDLRRLKEKVDAGADLCITQFFYEPEGFLSFTEEAVKAGIAVPILPGYMPIQTYGGFERFTKWCRTSVPASVLADLEAIKDDDAAVKTYGIGLAVATLRQLLERGVRALHFYTLNLSASVTSILEALAAAHPELKLAGTGSSGRVLPFKTLPSRPEETSRPIFWANRAASFLARTSAGEFSEFPNGRFSLASSPAFGELSDYYLAAKRPKVDRRAIWGTPQSVEDVHAVFAGFLQGRVPALPWCDAAPALETGSIYTNLLWLNKSGFLTINSQPRVNCCPSTDRRFGWGGSDGVVFQKSYLEFFCSPEAFARLLAAMPRYPSLTYHAVDVSGTEWTNVPEGRVTAVTWGVFRGEIVQPTVTDPAAFRVWSKEAYSLWLTHWQSTYDDEAARAGGAGSIASPPGKAALRQAAAVIAGATSASSSATAVHGLAAGGLVEAAAAAANGSGTPAQAKRPAAADSPVSPPSAAAAASVVRAETPDATARRLLSRIHGSYVLVNVVDNEFVDPSADIFAVFREVITEGLGPTELRGRVRELETDNATLREQLLRLRDLQGAAEQDHAAAMARAHEAETEVAHLRSLLREVEASRLVDLQPTHLQAHTPLQHTQALMAQHAHMQAKPPLRPWLSAPGGSTGRGVAVAARDGLTAPSAPALPPGAHLGTGAAGAARPSGPASGRIAAAPHVSASGGIASGMQAGQLPASIAAAGGRRSFGSPAPGSGGGVAVSVAGGFPPSGPAASHTAPSAASNASGSVSMHKVAAFNSAAQRASHTQASPSRVSSAAGRPAQAAGSDAAACAVPVAVGALPRPSGSPVFQVGGDSEGESSAAGSSLLAAGRSQAALQPFALGAKLTSPPVDASAHTPVVPFAAPSGASDGARAAHTAAVLAMVPAPAEGSPVGAPPAAALRGAGV